MSMFDMNEVAVNDNSPLKPGEKVNVVLQKVEVGEHALAFTFKGTDRSNAGTYSDQYWLSLYDKDGQYYDEEKSPKQQEREISKIKQIMSAYLPSEIIQTVKATSAEGFYKAVADTMMKNKDKWDNVPTQIKLLYKGKTEEKCITPTFGGFISTDFKPVGLVLSPKTNDAGIPWDRVLPMSHYIDMTPDSQEDSSTSFNPAVFG